MTQHVARSKLFMFVLLIIATFIAARAHAQEAYPASVLACREEVNQTHCADPVVSAEFQVLVNAYEKGMRLYIAKTDDEGVAVVDILSITEPTPIVWSVCEVAINGKSNCVGGSETLTPEDGPPAWVVQLPYPNGQPPTRIYLPVISK